MADLAKSLAGTAVGIGALGLVGESMKMIPKDFGAPMRGRGRGKKKRIRQRKQPSMIKGATNLMIGTALLGGAAGIVNRM